MVSPVCIFVFLVACVVVMAGPTYRPGLRILAVTPPKNGMEMEPIMSSFDCMDRNYGQVGYYADMENGCKYFHMCHKVFRYDGSYKIIQSTYKCPNETTFNQALLNCDWDYHVSPCAKSDYGSNKVFTTPAPWYPETTTDKEMDNFN